MTGEILNPVRWVDIRREMTPAERYLACCLSQGFPCQLGDAVPKESTTRNTIRSEVIRFFAYGGDVDHPVRGANILLQGAWIPPQPFLNLMFARIPYSLGMHKCHIGADILMIGAQCVGLSLNGSHFYGNLNGEGAKISGSVLFRDVFVAKGEIRLIAAHIGGLLDCESGKFLNPGQIAIAADSIRVDGDANFRDGFSAKGEVRIPAARIGGELDCRDGTFDNHGKCALHAEGAYVRNRIVMQGVSVTGETWLAGAYTNGELDCEGGHFDGGEYGVSLLADKVTASRGIALHKGFSANGEVRLLHARTDGNLDCSSGKFHSSSPNSLSADLIYVGGTVSLSDEFSAIGEVRFPNARMGALECDGKFENSGAIAFGASGIEVRGEVALRAQFQGEVMLIGAHIGRSLSVTGELNNLEGTAFNAERVEAKEGVLWRPKGGGGEVNFNFAKIGTLADLLDAWKPFRIALNGFTYGQFARPEDAQSRIDWLAKRPDGMPFSPLPYEQAAKVLRAMGKDIDAWDIEREKRKLQRTERHPSNSFKISRWGRLWGRAIDALTDFVYRPWKTVEWAIVVVFASALLFNFADKHGRIVPHQPIVLANSEYKSELSRSTGDGGQCRNGPKPTEVVVRLFPDYPEFSAFVYSLDVFIPFFALHQEQYWYPKPSDADREILLRIFPYWYWLEIIAGWILTSLFLLSITGLLRPRQSSGERD